MKTWAAAVSFVIGAVTLSGCGKRSSNPPGAAVPSAFKVHSLTAVRSGDHLHVTVTVEVRNTGTRPLVLTPPIAQLWIGKDKPAAPFIAPGLEPAVIAPGTASEAATHWWLAVTDLAGSLELEINAVRQPIHAGTVSLDSLPENVPVILDSFIK